MKLNKKIFISLIVVLLSIPVVFFLKKMDQYQVNSWFFGYVEKLLSGEYFAENLEEVEHLMFIIADHHEPGCTPKNILSSKNWVDNYKKNTKEIIDDYGRVIQYTWFYPWDHKCEPVMHNLNELVYGGLGEIEFHWHHGNHDNISFEAELAKGLSWFSSFGALLSEGNKSKTRFGFIHGNWALDNSTKTKHCGVNRELDILKRAGSYADFTFSTLSTSAQPSMFNSIYYAIDNDENKSYDSGKEAVVGSKGVGYMIFQGPSGFDFTDYQFEVGALEAKSPYKSHRVDLWARHSVYIKGFPKWRFIKVHTHGVTARDVILSNQFREMAEDLSKYAKNIDAKLHYITTREAYNLVKAVESGQTGDPNDYLDYEIKPPLNKSFIATKRFDVIKFDHTSILMQKSDTDFVTIQFKKHPSLISVMGNLSAIDYKFNTETGIKMFNVTSDKPVTVVSKDTLNISNKLHTVNSVGNLYKYIIN